MITIAKIGSIIYDYLLLNTDIGMIELFGENYISDKEAANKYGYSQSWFQARRCKGLEPVYIRMGGKGKVLYNVNTLDVWFKGFMEMKE